MSVLVGKEANGAAQEQISPPEKTLTDFINQRIGICQFKKDERGYEQIALVVVGTVSKAKQRAGDRWEVEFSEIVPWYKYNRQGCFWSLAYESSQGIIDLYIGRIQIISEDKKIASKLEEIRAHFKNEEEVRRYSLAKAWQAQTLWFKNLRDKAVLFQELERELVLFKTKKIKSDGAKKKYAEVIKQSDALANFLTEIPSHERPSLFEWFEARRWLANAWENYQSLEKVFETSHDDQQETIADFLSYKRDLLDRMLTPVKEGIWINRNLAHAVDSFSSATAHLHSNLRLNMLETQVSFLIDEHELSKLDV